MAEISWKKNGTAKTASPLDESFAAIRTAPEGKELSPPCFRPWDGVFGSFVPENSSGLPRIRKESS